MITLVRTHSANPDFIELVRQLDAELAQRDGAGHSFYAQYNKIDKINYVVLAYDGDYPAGCGAIKEYTAETKEVKRMFVVPSARMKGIGKNILTELEAWTKELSFSKCILETGKKQPEAIELYKRSGYTPIPNYGQYTGIENSVCFEKVLI
jgi:putative acetyltransferase